MPGDEEVSEWAPVLPELSPKAMWVARVVKLREILNAERIAVITNNIDIDEAPPNRLQHTFTIARYHPHTQFNTNVPTVSVSVYDVYTPSVEGRYRLYALAGKSYTPTNRKRHWWGIYDTEGVPGYQFDV